MRLQTSHNCNVNDLEPGGDCLSEEQSTSTKPYKDGDYSTRWGARACHEDRLQTISYPACRARHGVQHVCTFRVIFYGLRYCAVLMQSHSDDSQPFHILHRSRSPHNAQHSTSL